MARSTASRIASEPSLPIYRGRFTVDIPPPPRSLSFINAMKTLESSARNDSVAKAENPIATIDQLEDFLHTGSAVVENASASDDEYSCFPVQKDYITPSLEVFQFDDTGSFSKASSSLSNALPKRTKVILPPSSEHVLETALPQNEDETSLRIEPSMTTIEAKPESHPSTDIQTKEAPVSSPLKVRARKTKETKELTPGEQEKIAKKEKRKREKQRRIEAEESRRKLWDLFSQDHHEAAVELPLEYQRSFKLLHELEEAQKAHINTLRESLVTYTETSKDNGLDQTHQMELLQKLAHISREVVKASEEKIGLASVLYESVDHHIIRLDKYLEASDNSPKPQQTSKAVIPSETTANTEYTESNGATPPVTERAKSATPKRPKRNSNSHIISYPKKRVKKNKTSKGDNSNEQVGVEHFEALEHEPTFCYCKQVAFGEMVGCDNDDCPSEWFHLDCIGIKQAPKGEWYCRDCIK